MGKLFVYIAISIGLQCASPWKRSIFRLFRFVFRIAGTFSAAVKLKWNIKSELSFCDLLPTCVLQNVHFFQFPNHSGCASWIN